MSNTKSKKLNLRYVAATYPITGIMDEEFRSEAATIRELLEELDAKYGGFMEMFINQTTGGLNLNTMIYYGEKEKVPVAVLNIEEPVSDGARITFW